jgi:hypothetical protein
MMTTTFNGQRRPSKGGHQISSRSPKNMITNTRSKKPNYNELNKNKSGLMLSKNFDDISQASHSPLIRSPKASNIKTKSTTEKIDKFSRNKNTNGQICETFSQNSLIPSKSTANQEQSEFSH